SDGISHRPLSLRAGSLAAQIRLYSASTLMLSRRVASITVISLRIVPPVVSRCLLLRILILILLYVNMSDVLKHNRKLKTSSKVREFNELLRKELSHLQDDQPIEEILVKHGISPDEFRLLQLQAIEEGRPQYQKKLLVDVANLPDKGEKWFWHKYGPL